MKLSVVERINLLNVLPVSGDYTSLKLLRKLRESLSFNEDELKELEFRKKLMCPKCQLVVFSPSPMICETCHTQMEFTGDVIWKHKDIIKDIHAGEFTERIITDTLKMLDKNKVMPDELVSLFERLGLAPATSAD